MSEKINLTALFEAIDTKDTDSYKSFLTDDAVFRFGNMPEVNGKEAIAGAVNYFFGSIKSLRHETADTIDTGDRIITHGFVTYTRLDDSTLTVPFANVFNMQGNLVKDYFIFADVSALYS